MKRHGAKHIHRCHSDVSPHVPVSACLSTRRGERQRRRINPGSLFTLFVFCISIFLMSITQGMKTAVSWHSRIRERDALNAAFISARDKEEEEGGDNTQQAQKRDF